MFTFRSCYISIPALGQHYRHGAISDYAFFQVCCTLHGFSWKEKKRVELCMMNLFLTDLIIYHHSILIICFIPVPLSLLSFHSVNLWEGDTSLQGCTRMMMLTAMHPVHALSAHTDPVMEEFHTIYGRQRMLLRFLTTVPAPTGLRGRKDSWACKTYLRANVFLGMSKLDHSPYFIQQIIYTIYMYRSAMRVSIHFSLVQSCDYYLILWWPSLTELVTIHTLTCVPVCIGQPSGDEKIMRDLRENVCRSP